MSTRENLPWVEKYRPQQLDEVYGQDEIITILDKFVKESKLPHLLFYGPPGTGKTSTIVALARSIYGKNYSNMVLELNASDDRGIDVVRNQIKDFASTRQIFSKGFKLIILDEADAMTQAAQNALRRIIEKYTKNTRFCILANYAHKLTPALLSRCTRFRFQPLPVEAMRQRMKKVIAMENLKIDEKAEDALLNLSQGDMRRIFNVLQSSKNMIDEDEDDEVKEGQSNKEITEEMIYECCGMPQPKDIQTILRSILEEDWNTINYTIETVRVNTGIALVDIISGILEILETYEFRNEKTRISLLQKMANIEYAISKGGNENIQTSSLIGAIKDSFMYETEA